jgi:hypothetical protein
MDIRYGTDDLRSVQTNAPVGGWTSDVLNPKRHHIKDKDETIPDNKEF